MKVINLSSIANPISISVQNPSQSDYDRFIGLEHYDSGEPVITRFQGTELLTTSAKAFKANDILIARRNVYLKRAGIVFFDGITSGDSIILRLKEDTEKTMGYSREDLIRYIPFMLNSEHFWIYANKHADGMNSKRISKDTLLEYEFELPSIDEMRDISDKLWAAYRLKEAYKKLLVATDEMVKSQFIEMFKVLPVNGTISDLTEGAPTSVKKKYGYEDMIEYIDISSIDSTSKTVQGTSKHFVGKAPSRAQQCVKNGDILVSTVRPVNRNIAVIDNNIHNLVASTGFCVLRPKEGYRDYLLSVVTSDLYTEKMCDKASGGLYPAVNNSDVLNYGIHIPDEGLANRVSIIYKQADKSKFELKQCIENIDKVIKSLING